jgi:predicted aconitase with swiveling domain
MIVDGSHPQIGQCISGRVLAMRGGRGSSSSSSALAEMARAGQAPAAILLARADPVLIIGALICADLYGIAVPIGLVPDEEWSRMRDGAAITLQSEPPDLSISLG